MAPSLPPFESLPLQKNGPRGNAWGLFGPGDELGMINLLTPETTLTATKEIIHGIRISTDWPLNMPKVPCFNREVFHQHIKNKSPRTVNDDILTFNTQSSTQWDGFRHFGYQDHKVFFNGCKQEDIINSTRNGVGAWADKGGIVGRGVLLDYASWVTSQNRPSAPLETTEITVQDLNAIAKSQSTTFQPGDILFIHTGYISALSSLPASSASSYAKLQDMPAIGVKSNEETLRWLWERQFAAVAGDMPAFEALPFQSKTHWLHEWLLAGWGLPIGEFFDLEPLATECKRLGKWSFWFSSMPLKVPGGFASPPNGVAIL